MCAIGDSFPRSPPGSSGSGRDSYRTVVREVRTRPRRSWEAVKIAITPSAEAHSVWLVEHITNGPANRKERESTQYQKVLVSVFVIGRVEDGARVHRLVEGYHDGVTKTFEDLPSQDLGEEVGHVVLGVDVGRDKHTLVP